MDGGFGPRIIFELPGGIPITETVTSTGIIMAFLIGFSFIATRKFDKVPKGLQNFLELVVDGIYGLTAQSMGEEKKKAFSPYMGTLMIFLVFANLAGLLGIRPPTADLNTTFALAAITFIMIHGNGIKKKGVGGYLKGFLDPIALMLPINIIGELATPISLSFRLFGNIVGGLIIMNLLYGALGALSVKVGIDIPVFMTAIPAPLHIYFDAFAGILQSFIFTMLTMVFVSMAMD